MIWRVRADRGEAGASLFWAIRYHQALELVAEQLRAPWQLPVPPLADLPTLALLAAQMGQEAMTAARARQMAEAGELLVVAAEELEDAAALPPGALAVRLVRRAWACLYAARQLLREQPTPLEGRSATRRPAIE